MPLANQEAKIGGLRIQGSGYGCAIPITYGTSRASPILIDYTNFNAIPHKSTQAQGGKGGSSALTTLTYTYSATLWLAVCEGPIASFGRLWLGKNLYTTNAGSGTALQQRNLTGFLGSYPQSPWSFATTLADKQLFEGVNQLTIPAPSGSPSYCTITPTPPAGTTWSADFGVYQNGILMYPVDQSFITRLNNVGVPIITAGTATNIYCVKDGVYYFPSIIAGTNVTISFYYTNNTIGTRALNYSGIAYASCSNYDLGGSATLGNHSFEVVGVGTLRNGFDVNVIDVMTDFLTNANYGARFPYVGLTSQAWNYCQANGIFISPVLSAQQSAAAWLDKFSRIANLGLVWSSGALNFVPYGDTSVSGNSATYTPNTTPVYSLTDDDFQPTGGDPVTVVRKNQADSFNSVQVEYLNRNNQYNTETCTVTDQSNIEIYGARPMPPIVLHEACSGSIAKIIAQQILQRQLYIRNEYTFNLSWKYSLLEPMDIVNITDVGLGISAQPVRITCIEENENGIYAVTAEEMPNGVSQPAQYAQPPTGGSNINFNVSTPNPFTPTILTPPFEIASGALELWLAVAGPQGWGGCNIYVSSDGNTYKNVGQQIGNSRIGVLGIALPSGGSIDTVNTLNADLTQSLGQLYSGTADDAINNTTLCYVDGEYISYQNAVLASSNVYNLTQLYRGAYGSNIAAHSVGAPFIRIDDSVFGIPYALDQLGKTIFIKLQSFNQYQGNPSNLASLTAVEFVIPYPPAPPDVTNFSVQQNGYVVSFNWSGVDDFALKGYDIGYAHQGETNWDNFALLTESSKGTEMTNASVPPGTWVFGIRARDVVKQLSVNMATFNLIVTSTSPIVAQAIQNPDWAGTIVDMYHHYTGVLVPIGTKTSDQYVTIAPPAAPTLSSVAGGALAATTYYVKISYKSSTGETLASSESSLAVAANNLLQVTSPPPATGAVGWDVYVSTTTGAETEQNLSPIAIGTNWTEPTTGLSAGTGLPAANTTGWEVFDAMVPDPVSLCSYTTPIIDTGYDSVLRLYATYTASMGVGQIGVVQSQLYMDTWLNSGVDLGVYTPWVSGEVNMRYMKERLSLLGIVQGSVPLINAMTAWADTTPVIENVANITIAPGGTAVTFPQQYHSPPMVLCNAIGATALTANASNITSTGCTIHIFNSSGTDVGGTATYSATGA
jgi:hypothetical protein